MLNFAIKKFSNSKSEDHGIAGKLRAVIGAEKAIEILGRDQIVLNLPKGPGTKINPGIHDIMHLSICEVAGEIPDFLQFRFILQSEGIRKTSR